MKANELMIGDLLRVNKDVCLKKGTIVEVCVIDADNAFIEKGLKGCATCVSIKDHCEFGGVWVDFLEPIPLTPEILEKNGFTHSFGDSDFYDYEKWEKKVGDKTIRVIKDHDGWFCRVDDNKLTRSMGIAPAVHTMQNIIRIGGIDKEIKLSLNEDKL